MRNKLTVADVVLIIFLTLSSLGWLGFEFFGRQAGSAVEVYNQQGLYRRLELGRDASLSVPGPLGATRVVIHAGRVQINDSPCPDRLCIAMGSISQAGETLICAPNRVSVRVIAPQDAPDTVSY
ncbi:MAG: hypothetical protein BWY87_00570 [Deltaproteobacteria bacterium ADurb.Bin510]|nr:MAG: hypothetical protein BWY87_00570 [Deltaproteobacteria bacterium ADurb.Bin510]